MCFMRRCEVPLAAHAREDPRQVPADRDRVHVAQLDPRLLEAELGGSGGVRARRVLHPGEPLLLGHRPDLAVAVDEAGGPVVPADWRPVQAEHPQPDRLLSLGGTPPAGANLPAFEGRLGPRLALQSTRMESRPAEAEERYPEAKSAAEQWQRVVLNRAVDEHIAGLGPERLRAAEISGENHAGKGWLSHESLDYPEFDVCAPVERPGASSTSLSASRSSSTWSTPSRALATWGSSAVPAAT